MNEEQQKSDLYSIRVLKKQYHYYPVDTERKLNVHKTFNLPCVYGVNECLFSGSSINEPLFSILFRFCVDRIVTIANIEEAFLQIAVTEKTFYSIFVAQ